ncbi:cytoplasmic trehalase [Escherichia coli]|uniref:Cytoplasmic trehalase n=1 Tax=Escherichia coli TaxID=562 RepID=A0A376VUT7_ECOLX|nr:cytoplasmic trehalase [Escherichia coli]
MLCGCRTARCSTVTGTIATRRVTNPGLRTLKPRNILVARLTRCTAIYVRGRPPVGITLPVGCVILGRLASIRTTQFIPIDLNAFLFKLESAIANISALKGEKETEALFRQKASARRDAVNRYLWDDENGIYRDYDWRREQLALFSAAAIVPLYVGMANHEQADRLANAVRSRLLTPGGILASEYETGEQWDKPNGWAPLQWMAIQGFKMYGDDLLGDEIARNWLKTVNQFYLEQHKLIEKYHIADGVPREGGGGEYPLQDGFGWTNGVVRRLIGLYGEP